ncbi:MAG: DUF2805 domain-containing protein [bacterium]|nr:DUF2805 domain-containing protein [bacterium]
MLTLKIKDLSEQEIDHVLEMAWEDLTPFEAIEAQYGLSEADIVKIMKLGMKQTGAEIIKHRAAKTTDRHPTHSANGADKHAEHRPDKH